MPLLDRPNAVKSRLRSLAGLALLGSLLLVHDSACRALASSLPDVGGVSRVGLLAGTLVADVVVFWVAFQVLTRRRAKRGSALLPGAVLGGAAYFALQLVGSVYLKRVVAGARRLRRVRRGDRPPGLAVPAGPDHDVRHPS